MAVYCLSFYTLSNFDLADLDDTEFEALPDTCVWTMPPILAAAEIHVVGQQAGGIYLAGQAAGEIYAAGTVAGGV